MKRRRFIQTLAVTPATALPVAAESVASPNALVPISQPPTQAAEAPKLETAALDVAGDTSPRFFTAQQMAALRKLCGLLVPALNGLPGALEADAPEFLDFLIGKSGTERQTLYRAGLDALNAKATRQFQKAFAETDDAQAATLLAPLREAWTYVPPADAFARFLREAKADIRSATQNSREYVTAGASGGRRGGGLGQYWYPLD